MVRKQTPGTRAAVRAAGSNGARLEELGLSHLFVSGSKSRKAAEAILTGHEVGRLEVAKALELAPSSVSRVVRALEGGGVAIAHTEDPDTREARYRVTSLPRLSTLPESAVEFRAFPGAEITVELERTEEFTAEGGVIFLTSQLGRVRGRSPMHSSLVALSQGGLPLMRVVLLPGGGQRWVLGKADQPLIVDQIEYL